MADRYWLCPVDGLRVDSYRVDYAYAPCPGDCGNPCETPCRDRMTLAPCGHVVIGQEAIGQVEATMQNG